jgi:hypothetical protein
VSDSSPYKSSYQCKLIHLPVCWKGSVAGGCSSPGNLGLTSSCLHMIELVTLSTLVCSDGPCP